MGKPCRKCGATLTRRGLCWICRRKLKIPFRQKKYPPPLPTSALPGTPEKEKVMQDRATKRQRLDVPGDARIDVR